jgi:hypothetical protein
MLGIGKKFVRMTSPWLSYKDNTVSSNEIGLSTFAGHNQVDLTICSIISFYHYAKKILPVYLVDDGTLNENDKKLLNSIFKITIESRNNSNRKIYARLKHYKNMLKFRLDKETYHNKLRYDAILLNPFDRVICFDTDILYHNTPTEIISWITNKTGYSLYSAFSELSEHEFKMNYNAEFVLRNIIQQQFRVKSNPLFASAFLCIHDKRIVDLAKLDKIMKYYYATGYAHYYFAEETSFSILLNNANSRLLNQKTYLHAPSINTYNKYFNRKTVFVHYADRMKWLFYRKVKKQILTNLLDHLIKSNNSSAYGNFHGN